MPRPHIARRRNPVTRSFATASTSCRWLPILVLVAILLLLASMTPIQLVSQPTASPQDAQGSGVRSAEEVIAKCAAALGGEEAWRAIETLELTGRHTSFSHTEPFMLRRKRPDFYRFDHNETTFKATIAWDGESAWWRTDIPLFSKAVWPVGMPRPYLPTVTVEAEFEPPFIGARAKGHRIEWLGETRFEGERFQELRVTRERNPEHAERWFLDPESYLPVLRLSRGTFHGYFTEQITHFADYRQVAEVWIPHRVETELGNDFLILEVENVQINAPIDDQVFTRPLPAGMERLRPLAGRWQVAIESLDDPTLHPERLNAWKPDETISVIHSRFGGSLLEEEITVATDRPRQARRQISYDRFRDVFRIAHFDTFTEHLDILEGQLEEDGRLVLSNRDTGTPSRIHTQTQHTREILYEIRTDSFRLDREVSADGGANWNPEIRFIYTRLPGAED